MRVRQRAFEKDLEIQYLRRLDCQRRTSGGYKRGTPGPRARDQTGHFVGFGGILREIRELSTRLHRLERSVAEL